MPTVATSLITILDPVWEGKELMAKGWLPSLATHYARLKWTANLLQEWLLFAIAVESGIISAIMVSSPVISTVAIHSVFVSSNIPIFVFIQFKRTLKMTYCSHLTITNSSLFTTSSSPILLPQDSQYTSSSVFSVFVSPQYWFLFWFPKNSLLLIISNNQI